MSYYTPQAGDYKTYGYAGDPGFLSSLWRGVKKIAGPVIGGLIGGPFGAVLGGAVSGAPKVSPPMQFPRQLGAPSGFPIVGQVTMPGGASFSGGIMVPTGGRGGKFGGRGTSLAPQYAGGAVPSGYHFAKDGSGRLVRNRRMNVANPRALRRSMRRVQGFEKLARRTITFTRRTRMKKRKSS
jgi:hypothetical protein